MGLRRLPVSLGTGAEGGGSAHHPQEWHALVHIIRVPLSKQHFRKLSEGTLFFEMTVTPFHAWDDLLHPVPAISAPTRVMTAA